MRNFKSTSSFFSDNMQIVSVNYQGDTCVLELERQTGNFGKELNRS